MDARLFNKFLRSLLDDDNGISEEAMNFMVEIQEDESTPTDIVASIAALRLEIDATDGRYYIS